MGKVLIYGGSFNPLHNGHDAIIRSCANMPEYDGVWVMPSARRHDKPDLLDDDARLAMLRHYWSSLPGAIAARVYISDFEISLGEPSETLRTYSALKNTFPDIEFSYVFGADAINDMLDWRGGEQLRQELKIVIVSRHGHDVPGNHYAAQIELASTQNISSTTVRQRIRSNQSIHNIVPRAVLDFIETNKMYR